MATTGHYERVRRMNQTHSAVCQMMQMSQAQTLKSEHGYKETIVQEYDGITVVHHQGRYQHITEQFHHWAFYEYRMRINGECWNIVVDEDMSKVPTSYPGSQSTKLTHDFCYLDSKACDEIYTKFSFVEMGGRTLWPFYLPDDEQEQLWTWVSPRRFVIISNHPTNEKVNNFYSNKMHDHHILALRTACWPMQEIRGDSTKKKHRSIVLSEQCRVRSAHHETFTTGFEGKYGMAPVARMHEGSHGKRKHHDPANRESARQYDPTGVYSANDMHALNEAFQDEPTQQEVADKQQARNVDDKQWTYGQVPDLGPRQEGAARGSAQLAYARTLLAAVMEAAYTGDGR